MRSLFSESNIHLIFQISLLLKLVHSLFEIAAGIVLAWTSSSTVLAIANFLTRNELRQDPHDLVANLVERGAQSLATGAKGSAVFFLLSHGFVELVLVTGIFTEKRWAYPAFILALALLIGYQTYQVLLSFSGWLFFLTLFDIIVLVLTWHEYRLLGQRRRRVTHG